MGLPLASARLSSPERIVYSSPMLRVLILLVVAITVNAGSVYKWVDADGNVTFSDRPQPGSEEVNVQGLQTYKAQPIKPTAAADPGSDPATAKRYKTFTFTTPKSDQSFRDSGGTIPIELKLEPALRGGHRIKLFLDGAVKGEGRSASATLSNVDRGSHSLDAAVVDENGKEIARAGSVTFHLHRAGKKP